MNLQVNGGLDAVRYLLHWVQRGRMVITAMILQSTGNYNIRMKVDVELTKNLNVGANIYYNE